MSTRIGVKLSFNNITISYFLINRHVDYAIKYTKHIFENVKNLENSIFRDQELCVCGLIMNLMLFLCSNKLAMTVKQNVLKSFIQELPLKQYAGCFTLESWKTIEKWINEDFLNPHPDFTLAYIYVC